MRAIGTGVWLTYAVTPSALQRVGILGTVCGRSAFGAVAPSLSPLLVNAFNAV